MRTEAARDKGAVIPIVALLLPVILIATAFSIDLGRQRALRRDLQADADVVALDLVRLVNELPDPTVAALGAQTLTRLNASRGRNGLPPVSGWTDLATHGAEVRWGTWSSGSCGAMVNQPPDDCFVPLTDPAAYPDAVRVTFTDEVDYLFQPGSGSATRSAVARAGDEPIAGFQVGSRLAAVDTSNSPLLNPLLSALLGSNIDLDAADYNSLVGASVSLLEIATELGLGSASELLDTTVGLRDFYLAQVAALEKQGNTAAAEVLEIIGLKVPPGLRIPVASLVDVALGAEAAAAQVGLDVFGLITSGLFVANGTNAIAIPNLGVSIPGVTSLTATLSVTERPRIAFGPEGTQIHTAQVRLTIVPSIPLDLDLVVARVAVIAKLPITVEVGGAIGTLTNIDCASAPERVRIQLNGQAVNVNVGVDLDIILRVLLPLAEITVDGVVALSPTTTAGTSPWFSYASDFLPPVGTGSMVSVPPPDLGLGNALNAGKLQSLTVNVKLLGLLGLPLPLGQILSPIALALNPVLGLLDTLLIQPLTRLLGIQLAGGDVGALDLICDDPQPKLVG